MKACALSLASSCIRSLLNLTSAPLLVSIWRKTSAPLLLRCALLHANAPEQKRMAVAPWMNSPCIHLAPSFKLQGFLSNPQGFLAQNPHEVQTLSSLRWCTLLLFLTSLKWRIKSPKCTLPSFSLLMPTLKDQWPRLDLAKSNQWVRSTQIISLRKPTFLSCFMSINSPTLWINCHFMT